MTANHSEGKETVGCPTCDKEFDTGQGMKIHHSLAHDEPVPDGIVECAWCGERLDIPPSRAKESERNFCGRDCQGEWYAKHQTGENNPNYESVGVECDWCGVEFSRQPANVSETNFCSTECHSEWLSVVRSGEQRSERVEVDCDHCGSTLKRVPSEINEHNFCDRQCMNREWSEIMSQAQTKDGEVVNCDNCGELLYRTQHRLERQDKHFCDDECHGEWRSENITGPDHPNWVGRSTVECANCEVEFQLRPQYAGKYDHHFCTTECRGEWNSEHLTKEANPNGGSWTTTECEYCARSFEVPEWRLETDPCKYCSVSCQAKDATGEDSFAWKGGGSNEYGPGWTETKKQNVRMRDNHTCQHPGCELTSELHKSEHGRDLHVHHIRPIRVAEDKRAANRMDNLITLCKDHHLQWEKLAPLTPENANTNGGAK